MLMATTAEGGGGGLRRRKNLLESMKEGRNRGSKIIRIEEGVLSTNGSVRENFETLGNGERSG